MRHKNGVSQGKGLRLLYLEVCHTSRKGEFRMPRPLANLEIRRTELLRSLGGLKDMRPGSIVGAVWRCGKPN